MAGYISKIGAREWDVFVEFDTPEEAEQFAKSWVDVYHEATSVVVRVLGATRYAAASKINYELQRQGLYSPVPDKVVAHRCILDHTEAL